MTPRDPERCRHQNPTQPRVAVLHGRPDSAAQLGRSLPRNKKGSRERDPYALSPSIRFRRGGTGPPREEETAASCIARPMPEPEAASVVTVAMNTMELGVLEE